MYIKQHDMDELDFVQIHEEDCESVDEAKVEHAADCAHTGAMDTITA